MRKFVLLITLAGLVLQSAFAQTTYATKDTAYVRAVEQALVHLKKGDCQPCLDAYKKAFAISQKSALSTLRAAVCAWQCGQKEQADTYLRQATVIDWWICEDVWGNAKEYPELDLLRSTTLATDLQRYIDERKRAEGRNPELERELAQIFLTDNRPRLRLDSLGRQYGFNSPQTKDLWAEISRIDSLNLLKIEKIFQQYGYPGKHLVGEKQSLTAWLVVQHSPLAIQETYLPLIRKAADQGELEKQFLAMLVDRIHVFKGEKQVYGSQVQNGSNGKPQGFHPIEDEANVNKRRSEVGLPPLETYARHFGFEYIPPKK